MSHPARPFPADAATPFFPYDPKRDIVIATSNKRIDYVFVRGAGPEVTRAEVVLNRPVGGGYPSDHWGVLAEIAAR